MKPNGFESVSVEDIDRNNKRIGGRDSSSYICVCCRNYVSNEDSYSNQYSNLHCSACANRLAQENNMRLAQWCQKFIWNA